MQVKVACEKIKEQTTANKKYISNMLNEIGIDMSAMTVLKILRDMASSSSLDAACDISKTDIAVGAAD